MQRMAALLKRAGELLKYLVVDGVDAIRNSWYVLRVHVRHRTP
jgi:hypothetical protein